jgi:thymidylate kinase
MTTQLPSEIHYIAIEGVIGVGKTTLARMLSDKLGARLVLEKFQGPGTLCFSNANILSAQPI